MKKLEVFGATKLKGQIRISGSKNASLPILAATLLSNKKISLANLPRVKDIETMILLLKSLGSIIEDNKKELIIKNTKQTKTFAAYSLVKTMRAGILVLGPLLAKFGKAKVSLPGGCAIGRDAFLEPEILICPLSFAAPKTSNFFMVILLVKLLQFDPYIFLYGQRTKFREIDLLLKIKIEQHLHLHKSLLEVVWYLKIQE